MFFSLLLSSYLTGTANEKSPSVKALSRQHVRSLRTAERTTHWPQTALASCRLPRVCLLCYPMHQFTLLLANRGTCCFC